MQNHLLATSQPGWQLAALAGAGGRWRKPIGGEGRSCGGA